MFTHRSRRPLATLLIASAAALLAPAAAAQAAGMPVLQQATFKVTVEAQQTTSWRLVPRATVADCMPLVRVSGTGRETTTFKLTSKTTAYRVNGEASFVPAVGKTGFPPAGWAKTSRSGAEYADAVPGSCAGNPGGRSDGGPYDCGSRRQLLVPSLQITRNRLRLTFSEGLPAPLVPARYESCPFYASSAVKPVSITEIPSLEKITAGEAFGRFKQHVLLARRTFKLDTRLVQATTTISWTATITRTGAIR